MSDRLTLTNAIIEAGIAREQAERLATVIFEVVRDNVATKADLSDLAHRLTMRGIYGLTSAGAILFSALHLWPPH